jgi:hypothetical protein
MKTNTSLVMAVVAGALCACLGPASAALAYPPDPDNAALLYYQAFLFHEQPGGNDGVSKELADFVKGTTGPTSEIKQYVQNSHSAIEYVTRAAQRGQCDWGFVYSKGFSVALPQLTQCRSLAFLVLGDARLLAADGHYREALERCLSAKKLARHVGDDILIALLVGHAIDALADDCIRDILGMMPPDSQTLAWLKGQLATVSTPQGSFAKGLKYEQEMALDMMQMNRLPELREALKGNDSQPAAPRLPAKIDEEFLAKNREYYVRYMATMQATLAGPLSYAEKYAALKTLEKQMTQEAGQRTDAALTAALAPALNRVYSIETKAQARANALRVGIELLIAKTQTGTLPERLPANTLKDPFSGQDYLYQKTATGFVLRCQGKDLDKDTVYEYAFIVK